MTPQPPVGVWKRTIARRLLWAVQQTLHRIERAIPEQPNVDEWAERLDAHFAGPVADYPWEDWYAANVQKAEEPELPDDLELADPEGIVTELWEEAGMVRTTAEGLPFDPDDLAAALDETMGQVTGITEAQQGALRRMMGLALEAEDDQFKFARRVRDEFAGFSKTRAELIAVTEWNRAASTATRLGYLAQGVTHLRWFTVGDSRVCPVCTDNAAAGELPIRDGFPSGHLAPPAHPGCRCNIASAFAPS